MKSWELSEELRADMALSERVNRTRKLIDEVLGPTSSGWVSARWTMTTRPDGRRTLSLNLSDWTWPDGVEAQFSPEELDLNSETRWKIHRLWGDLLQARNHHQLAELQAEGQ